jgi:hypothetical protein
MKLIRVFLIGVIASLSLAALLGIYLFLGGWGLGSHDESLIFSTLTLALFSLTSLGAGIVMDRGSPLWRWGMIPAFAVSAVGAVVYLSSFWFLGELVKDWWGWEGREVLHRAMGVIAVWAVALPLAGLLGLTRFGNALTWVRGLSIALVYALALTITALIVLGFGTHEELLGRGLGVLSILTLLGLIITPILYRVHGIDRVAKPESTPLTMKITCPRCLREQTISTGRSRCENCRLRFALEIEEPRCPKCGYLLHNLTLPRCPECGTAMGAEELPPPVLEDIGDQPAPTGAASQV